MMHQTRLAGADLDGAHPSPRGELRGEDEVPIDFWTGSGQFERAPRFQHQVGLAELPLIVESGRRRDLSGGTFGRAGTHPSAMVSICSA